jgi:hypothetical protein
MKNRDYGKSSSKTKRKGYADGGMVDRIGDKIKSVFSVSGKPDISGGFKDTFKRREERMAAIERGEPDPGQERKPRDEEEPVKKARGGFVSKGK